MIKSIISDILTEKPIDCEEGGKTMCGRYYIEEEDSEEISWIINEVKKNNPEVKTGEIYPSNIAPILTAGEKKISVDACLWGFPGFGGKNLIINARSESVQEKPMFRDAFFQNRCVVPSTGFYEWNTSKKKYRFQFPDTNSLYMAALRREFGGEERFVILTAAANPSVAGVHHRMPVLFHKDRIHAWLFHLDAAVEMLATPNAELISVLA
jgi:putative SOS response-associated peptidase YedK